MATSSPSNIATTKTTLTEKEEEEEKHKYNLTHERYYQILPNLPKCEGWSPGHLVKFQDFWLWHSFSLLGLMLTRDHFKSRPTDVFLASSLKTGTTWLRALIFATMNRDHYDFSTHPLLLNHPHDLFPHVEKLIFSPQWVSSLDSLPSPRLFSTHLAYTLLPGSLTFSGSKFVYVCRDPKDVIVSLTFFLNDLSSKRKDMPLMSIGEVFDLFCQGTSPHGPYWDHVLGYWKASLKNPDKILFLKYEDIKKNPLTNVMKLAEFLGHPFLDKEEKEGVVEEIITLCSFQTMKNLEVNKATESSSSYRISGNNIFFRKGEVGDWKNHLTPEMEACIDSITEEKLRGSGFFFGCSP